MPSGSSTNRSETRCPVGNRGSLSGFFIRRRGRIFTFFPDFLRRIDSKNRIVLWGKVCLENKVNDWEVEI